MEPGRGEGRGIEGWGKRKGNETVAAGRRQAGKGDGGGV
jgi:hypothetical protein